ncbi:MAG: GNAT family N-acetyltransferase [Paludibacteraceae bacterium]|nr:GNAT family N-acetyltransferase [Paludibacteraceae bacterium]
MQEVSRDIFYQTVETWEEVPFPQTAGWTLMQSGNKPKQLRYFLDVQIGCVAHVKRCLGLTLLMIDTECWKTSSLKPAVISRFYEAVRQVGFDMIEVNSRRPYSADYEVGVRQAGFLRPVGSFSFELTNLINLAKPLSFNENWRRNLKLSEEFGLFLQRLDRPTDADIEDFLALYRQMCAHKNLPLPFSKEMLRTLLDDNHFRLCFLCRGEERLSAIVYHHCGTHAGLLYAANGDKANEVHAGFQLYKQLLELLAGEGVLSFDMEKMGASVHSTNAVFLFKQGIRGELQPLCGEWSWYKRRWYGVGMYWVKKYLWKRMQA